MTMLDNLLSLPSLLLFHITHTLSSLRRPIILVSILCLLSNPTAAIRKLKIIYLSLLYLILCNDKSFKIPKEDPASYFPPEMGGNATHTLEGATYKSKTVILIRHGESTWNDTFNPGDRNKLVFLLFYIPNMIYAIVTELYFFVSGKDSESWFFDSALSGKGVRQSEGLRKFLKKEKMRLGSIPNKEEERAVKLLLALEAERGGGGEVESHVVSSNLRRAISTAAIGLSDRFALTTTTAAANSTTSKDTITLLPCLQEISRNPDALSIIPAQGVAHPTWCDKNIPGISDFSSLVNTSLHAGNKPINTNGLLRLNQFCRDIFNNDILPKDVIIAAGHSLFFRSFFQCFLPREPKGEEHISKKKKIVNGGVVMVTLHEVTLGNKKKEYMIDRKSVTIIYGGFGKHTKG